MPDFGPSLGSRSQLLSQSVIPYDHSVRSWRLGMSLKALAEDIVRWKTELASGQIHGTLLHGIAKKAVDSFEELFRAHVRRHRTLAGEDKTAHGKPFERFTLGEVINYMTEHDALFTETCRRTRRGAELLKNRRLMTAAFRKSLDKISGTRNCLHHRPTDFAPAPRRALHEKSVNLLNSLGGALADPFFECTAADTDVKAQCASIQRVHKT